MATPSPAPIIARTVATSPLSNAIAGENPAWRHRRSLTWRRDRAITTAKDRPAGPGLHGPLARQQDLPGMT